MDDGNENLHNFHKAAWDVSADIFNFSLPGYGGTFIFRPEGDIMISADEPIKIEDFIEYFSFSGFKITESQYHIFESNFT